MSDLTNLQILVDNANAVKNLKQVETSLNKTESAASSLKNILKDIGLSVGFTYLVKQTLKLEDTTDALNRRFKQFFGTTGQNSLKELRNNFALANRDAKELLTTAGKFGSTFSMNKQSLISFSSELSKLASDVAAYYAIDDINSVLEKFGMATLGRTQGLREFGVQIETTSDYFKNLVTEIQNTTGASEQQAKQLAILQEAQRQLSYTQGSAAEQINSGWNQLNNLFSNFKDILAEVGGVFSKIFTPILQGLNNVLSIPLTKTLVAWGIAIGTLTTITGFLVAKLKAVGQTISKAATEFKEASNNINTGLKSNDHNARRFGRSVEEAYASIVKLQKLKFLRSAYKMEDPNKYGSHITKLTTQINAMQGITKGSIQALDEAAKNVDLRSVEISENMKSMFEEILFMTNTANLSLTPSLKNVIDQFKNLGKTSGGTTKSFVNLASILNVINPKIKSFSSGLTSFLTADLGKGISNIKTFFTGAAGPLLVFLKSLGAILITITTVVSAAVISFVGFSDAWDAIKDEFHIGKSQLEKDSKELEEMFNKLDRSIFEITKMNYIDKITEGFKRMFGSIFDFQTEGQKKEAELIDKYWEDAVNKAVTNTNNLWSSTQKEIEKFEASTKEQKLKILREELEAAKSTLSQLEAEGKRLQGLRGTQSNKDALTREKDLQTTIKNWAEARKRIKSINDEIAKLMEDNAQKTLNTAKTLSLAPTQTAIQGVEAASMEALKLQSREYDVQPEIKDYVHKFFDNFMNYKGEALSYLRKISTVDTGLLPEVVMPL